MIGLAFAILFGINFVSLPCEGKIFPPDFGKISVVPPGGNLTIAWKIDPAISVSDLNIREWVFLPTGETLAEIIADEDVTIKSTTFFASSIEIIKPSTLVLKNVDKRFNGKYQFEIRYENLRKQSTSIVDVFVAVTPVVSVNCSSSTTLNESEYFLCGCKGERGNPPADVTWYKDNQLIVTGKEETILRFPNVDKDNSGTYRCETRSGIPEATNETTIELIVNYKPINTTIMIKPEEAEVDGNVTITCNSVGRPEPSYQITYNATVLGTDKTHNISKVMWSDAGTYTCIAWNKLGSQSASANLTVEKPTVTIDCDSRITVDEGGNVNCLCRSEGGNLPASIRWYKDGGPIGNSSFRENRLTLSNVAEKDSGKYKCVARSHSLTDEKSIEVIVNLNYKPKDTKIDIEPKEVEDGGQVTLTCSSTGRPDPSFTVTHVSTQTIYNSKVHQISKAKKSDGGEYICTATNILGNDVSKSKTLHVRSIANRENDGTSVVEWHIVVTLMSGIILGFLLAYIVWCSRHRWRKNRKPAQNPHAQVNEADTTYQELDLSKMNTEDNYQSLRGNAAANNEPANNEESTYTELSKTRDEENKYQSLS